MNKITAEHLSRAAYVYVRQSTPGQLANNPESRRRQYALKDRAHSLGWENVIVVDDDLGHTASGTERLGFEQLLTAVCTSAAGAVLAIEDSRLARNLREWHTLLEFCGLVNCLLIDEANIYDPRQVNDRLLLGMKGTFSELELSLLRQRSQEALRLKAARGELYKNVPIGYVRIENNKLEMDPDQRVREAIQLAFRKFEELGSIRQVGIWLADERIQMPVVVYRDQSRMVAWQLPRYSMLHRLFTNPIYAGAYAYGRTGFKVRIKDGRKAIARGIRRPQEEWDTLIPNHHQGYISWEDYQRNQRIIKGNANMKGVMVPGSPRDGVGVLAGLLRCGHCGRKLMVHHSGYRVATYVCSSAGSHGRPTKCLRVGNLRVDAAVSEEVLRVIAPLGLDAALQVLADRERMGTERLNQMELALKQARYEASRAERQYNAVDPLC
ncbi:MAG: recombinase family protein [Alphaproteobacteria bacterium]|nr:recombinase family protein [Alphaproteobacteria bacterium]